VPFKVHLANFHALGYNKFMKLHGIFPLAGKKVAGFIEYVLAPALT
jgi:hypothetical protein